MSGSNNYERIYDAVCAVPEGRVATYGQIARVAGLPRHARQVGYALNTLPDGIEIPWHRIINSKGEISPRQEGNERRQRDLLEAEGVTFNRRGRVDLTLFQWEVEA